MSTLNFDIGNALNLLCNCIFCFIFSDERLKELDKWLKSKPHFNAERQVCGTSNIDAEVVRKIEETVDNYKKVANTKNVIMQIKPHLLYKVRHKKLHTNQCDILCF